MKNLFNLFLFVLLFITATTSFRAQTVEATKASQKETTAENTQEDDSDVVKVDTVLIFVPVTVSDKKSRYVTDLNQSDFKIYDEGVEQEITFFGHSEEPFSVVLLFDTSRSMTKYLQDEQDAAIALIEKMRKDDRAALITFNDKTEALLPYWTSNASLLRDSIRKIKIGGETRLHEALTGVFDLLKRTQGRKAIIIFTDSVVTDGDRYVNTLLKEVEELGTLIYVVRYDYAENIPLPTVQTRGGSLRVSPFGRPSEDSLLNTLVDRSGGRLFQMNLGAIERVMNSISDELRHQYFLGYYPNVKVKKGKRHKIKIKVNREDTNIRTRQGYTEN
jgi:Ca-activated chloride channel family protein